MPMGAHRLWPLAFLVLAIGCDDEPPPSAASVGEPVINPQPREIDDSHRLYDPTGVPLPSDTMVAGLTLPRGLTEMPLRNPRRHAYTSIVPPSALLRYFGPRLITMQVEREGDTVTYVDARPRDARGGVVPLTVTISRSSTFGQESLVRISERPPPPPADNPVTEEEVREHFRQLNERRE